jgi:geranylgeranyl diphosphate synthase type I
MFSFFTEHKPYIAEVIKNYIAAESTNLRSVSPRSAKLSGDIATLATRGKMIRGGLVCLGYQFEGKKLDERCLKLAAAMEIAHTGLLIHDDIMDGDTLRRGEKALHTTHADAGKKYGMLTPERFGEATATCLADIAFFSAFNLLTQALAEHPEILTTAMSLFTKELALVGAAQLQDVYSGNHPKPATLATILSTYRFKTARYTFSLPLALGLTAASGNAKTITTLTTFGEHVGIIFQIRDDEIGLFGTEKEIGKPVGSDIRESKKTLYHHFLYRFASVTEKKRLGNIFGNQRLTKKDIAYVRSLVNAYNIPEKIEKIVAAERESALAALDQLTLSTEHANLFNDIMAYTERRMS